MPERALLGATAKREVGYRTPLLTSRRLGGSTRQRGPGPSCPAMLMIE
jgi:hypothetical protein